VLCISLGFQHTKLKSIWLWVRAGAPSASPFAYAYHSFTIFRHVSIVSEHKTKLVFISPAHHKNQLKCIMQTSV